MGSKGDKESNMAVFRSFVIILRAEGFRPRNAMTIYICMFERITMAVV